MEEHTQQSMPQIPTDHNYETFNKLVETSMILNSTLSQNILLDHIMQAAIQITGSEAASILLVDPNTKDLHFVAASGSGPLDNFTDIVVPLEGSIAGLIVRENRAVVIDDVVNDPRHFRQADEELDFQTRSLLGVPMRIKDRLIGVLEAVNRPEPYTNEDVRYITILASQAAVAIENARLINELRRAKADLEKLNKLKNDFISIASHELRTPLGVILGYATFLKEDTQGDINEHAERVFNSAIHLRSLIEDMTSLRYIQFDAAELNIQPVSVNDIVDMTMQHIGDLAETKEQALIVEPARTLMLVNADADRIVMALGNVLNNAVKFSEVGGLIVLSVEARNTRDVWIKVRDNGMGITRDQLERVFDQFYQVEDPMIRAHGGLGLGLSITKAIVEKHNGRVWVESDGPGKGCTVTISLPIAH